MPVPKFHVLFISSVAMNCAVATAQTSGVYVFGDSAVEQGNRYSANPGDAPPVPPYFSADGFIRDSNGPVWVEYAYPGIVPFLLDPATNRTNFGFSAAQTGRNLDFAGAYDTGVLAQIDRFAGSVASGGTPINPDDLFFIDGGPNDIIIGAFSGGQDPFEAAIAGGENLAEGAARLSALGAKYVFVNDFVDASLAPVFNLPEFNDGEPSVRDIVSAASEAGSAALRDAVSGTIPSLAQGQQIIVVNTRELISAVQANPAAYGLSNVTDACFDDLAGSLCSAIPAEQNAFLFWDNAGHPTETGQRLLANYFLATEQSVTGARHRELAGAVSVFQAPLNAADSSAQMRNSAFLNGAAPGWTAYTGGGVSSLEFDDTLPPGSIDADQALAAFGFELATDGVLLGGAFSVQSYDVEVGQLTGEERSHVATLYTAWKGGRYYAFGKVHIGDGALDRLTRDVEIAGFDPASDPEFVLGGGSFEAGIHGGTTSLRYSGGVAMRGDVASLSDDALESGAPGLELRISTLDRRRQFAELTGRIAWSPGESKNLTLGADGAAGYALQDRTRVDTLLLGTTATPVALVYDSKDDFEGRFSPFIRYGFGDGLTLEARYDGRFTNGSAQHYGMFSLSKTF